MLKKVEWVWAAGVAGNTVQRRRQIELANQIGLFGAVATAPYQLFYYFYDFAYFYGVFIANIVFTLGYLSVLALNASRRYELAQRTLLINVNIQMFVVTAFIGADAGVNLFYFTIAAVLVFMNQRGRRLYIARMALLGTLYMASYFLFTPSRALSPVPEPWVNVMYVGSGVGVLTLLGIFLCLFRQQIDQAERELMTLSRHFKTLSNTDPLTGLANRRVLDEALEREWSRLSRDSGALSIIMCDIDHFKRFNDRYGHDAGDECLKRVTAALKEVLSRPSDLIARYGGEEFVIVLPNTAAPGALHIASRLCKAVEALKVPNEDSSTSAWVTLSAGVSSTDNAVKLRASVGGGVLLKGADQALYQAKTSGRNRAVYLPSSTDTLKPSGGLRQRTKENDERF
ncbi:MULTISPECIES: diguanylate cyclase [unclassified Halomonas]|uniref:GGDEF domain-containing protein n=1 Tax=unclassified Halomonas TaxID=2609666 RepID=UPI0020769A91|nr:MULTISPECIES: diguanylate cyclase [unclassified Halomonas]